MQVVKDWLYCSCGAHCARWPWAPWSIVAHLTSAISISAALLPCYSVCNFKSAEQRSEITNWIDQVGQYLKLLNASWTAAWCLTVSIIEFDCGVNDIVAWRSRNHFWSSSKEHYLYRFAQTPLFSFIVTQTGVHVQNNTSVRFVELPVFAANNQFPINLLNDREEEGELYLYTVCVLYNT